RPPAVQAGDAVLAVVRRARALLAEGGRALERAALSQELQHLVVREAPLDPTLPALDVGRRPERVQHRLLGRLDGRGEERVELAALELLPVLSDRESEEDLAAAVV